MKDSKDFSTVIVVTCFGLIMFPIIMIGSLLTHSFVTWKLWDWLAVTHFNAVPISFWLMTALCLAVDFLLARPHRPVDEKLEAKATAWGLYHLFIMPWVILGLVYVVKTWLI